MTWLPDAVNLVVGALLRHCGGDDDGVLKTVFGPADVNVFERAGKENAMGGGCFARPAAVRWRLGCASPWGGGDACPRTLEAMSRRDC